MKVAFIISCVALLGFTLGDDLSPALSSCGSDSSLSKTIAALLLSNCKTCKQPVVEDVCEANAEAYSYIKALGIKYSYNYGTLTGPDRWKCLAATCEGVRQTPIDIITKDVQRTNFSKPLEIYGYDSIVTSMIITNDNFAGAAYTFENDEIPYVEGGHLSSSIVDDQIVYDKYKLIGHHFHWGVTSYTGSEHTIDGKTYSGELHFIYAAIDKYGSFAECLNHGDGLTVMGYPMEEDYYAPDAEILQDLDQLGEFGSSFTRLDLNIPFSELVGRQKFTYFHYLGGLTTPPCFEVVHWNLVSTPLKYNSKQMNDLRTLTGKNDFATAGNHRPVQPLHDRIVYIANGEYVSYAS